jgi:peptidyl-prolyl cis-trans isomerase-like 4
MAVLLETSLGDLVIDLYINERPKTCLNFLKLCKVKYYNYNLFYNVQTNFIAQCGDPSATGSGGESIWGVIDGERMRYFESELTPRLKHLKKGTVSMTNNGSNCHGSQFIITLRENLDYLDNKHTIFGEIAEGFDVLDQINTSHADKDGRPLQDICIFHTVILDDPFDDPPGLIAPSRSPSPPAALSSDFNHIGVDEDVNEYEGMTAGEIQEAVAERESKANAHILEMVGDIPDADARPPENVLFVCKLNPATSSEDLEIIFSRFGPIVSCEVIRDQKSGDSLQYAFVEFEKEEDCIKAYFKMDNVLIDDRRIHVDFSQSLAKVKHQRQFNPQKEENNNGNTEDNYEMVFDNKELMRSKEGRRNKGKKPRDHSRDRNKERRERFSRSPRRKRSRSRDRRQRSRSLIYILFCKFYYSCYYSAVVQAVCPLYTNL